MQEFDCFLKDGSSPCCFRGNRKEQLKKGGEG
jgi:hypothetical protein